MSLVIWRICLTTGAEWREGEEDGMRKRFGTGPDRRRGRLFIALCLALVMTVSLAGCGAKADAPAEEQSEVTTDAQTEEQTEKLTEEQALEAVKNYCYLNNPDLKDMEASGSYIVNWEVSANDAGEIVVLYRSYTGAEIRYYIDPSSGEAFATEFVPGITEKEEKTDERFNVRDYLNMEVPTTEPAEEPAAESTADPGAPKYEFDPHLYVSILDPAVPQDYWESFYHLCDALRAGEDEFECSSEGAYRWATDPATLAELFPAACTKIKAESGDGSAPFENGVGRISYQMPAEEFAERQAQFEEVVENVLNTYLEPDDTDYEKCLKLYDYMSLNYSYDYDFVEVMPDGANYLTIMTGKGECIELSSVYAYFLLQAGVEALQVGCHASDMDHAWTYLMIDGKGYHSDPTWALRSVDEGDDLPLYYFLMTGERRTDTGCPVDDLTAPLLPKYWANLSGVEFPASDDGYSFPPGSFLESFDEENRTVRYRCEGEERSFRYDQN